MYNIKYQGNARAIYDPSGMAKRDAKNKMLIEKGNGKEKNVSNKTVYSPGTVFCGVSLPTGQAIEVDEKEHPVLIKKVKAHIANAKNNERYDSPFTIEKAK